MSIFRPGETLDRVQTARMTAANTVAGDVLQRVLPICLDLVGARHVLDTHPMQRVVRDATTALAHARYPRHPRRCAGCRGG